MGKQNFAKTNFSSGEVSPLLAGRIDVTRNKNGAAVVNNFIVRPQGVLSRRMGTRYLNTVRDSTQRTYLIPFQFSDAQAFILEFGNKYIRIYKDEQAVKTGGHYYQISTPYSSAVLKQLSFCQSADVLYLAHPNYYPRTLARFSDTDWELKKMVHEDGPYRAPKDSDRLTTLWLRDIVHRAKITSTDADFSSGDVGKFIQYYDDGFLVIGEIKDYIDDYTVRIEPKTNVIDAASIDKRTVLSYSNSDSTPRLRSSIAIWSSESENSYIKANGTWRFLTTHRAAPEKVGTDPDSYSADVMLVDDAEQPDMLAVTGDLTVVTDYINATLKASENTFSAPRDNNRHFRLNLSGKIVWGWIESVSGAKTASVKLGNPVPLDWKGRNKYLNDTRTTNWKLGAWYKDNFPACVSIYQQRLVFASTALEPNRLWFSQTDDFVSFATTNKFSEVLDNSGFTALVGNGEVNAINWIQPTQVLLIGTDGEEFQIKPSSLSEPLTPTNIQITQQTAYGSRKMIRPIKIGPATLFVQRHGQSLRELQYNFEIDSFVARDLTIVAEHIIRKNGYAVQMAYVQVPYTLLWVLCSNGKLLSFTYEKEHEVFAWSQHTVGTGFVESIAVIPNQNNQRDDLYMVVKRTVSGRIRRYIEVMAQDFIPTSSNDKAGMLYLDSAVTYSGSPVKRIHGLQHLEGKTVGILADHAVHPNRTVHNGVVDLQLPASHVYVGENFVSSVRTLPMDEGSLMGTGLGKIGKIVSVDIQLYNSLGLKYGPAINSATYPLPMVGPEPIMGQSPPLFTGFVKLTDESGFSKNRQFYIVQDQPYPLNILSLTTTVVVNE